jgi:hypothetical protein
MRLMMSLQFLFSHVVTQNDIGYITHLWTTYDKSVDNGVIIRY